MNIETLKPLSEFVGFGPFRTRSMVYRAAAAGDIPVIEIGGRKHSSVELITAHLERMAGLTPPPTNTPTAERRRRDKIDAELERRGL